MKVRGHYGALHCRGPFGTPVFLWVDLKNTCAVVNPDLRYV